MNYWIQDIDEPPLTAEEISYRKIQLYIDQQNQNWLSRHNLQRYWQPRTNYLTFEYENRKALKS